MARQHGQYYHSMNPNQQTKSLWSTSLVQPLYTFWKCIYGVVQNPTACQPWRTIALVVLGVFLEYAYIIRWGAFEIRVSAWQRQRSRQCCGSPTCWPDLFQDICLLFKFPFLYNHGLHHILCPTLSPYPTLRIRSLFLLPPTRINKAVLSPCSTIYRYNGPFGHLLSSQPLPIYTSQQLLSSRALWYCGMAAVDWSLRIPSQINISITRICRRGSPFILSHNLPYFILPNSSPLS